MVLTVSEKRNIKLLISYIISENVDNYSALIITMNCLYEVKRNFKLKINIFLKLKKVHAQG